MHFRKECAFKIARCRQKKNHFNDNLKSKNILIPILFLPKIFNLRFGNFDVLDT